MPTPTVIAGTYTQVAAGSIHSLGLRPDGTLAAWGGNSNGQLGRGNTTATTAPTQEVTTGTSWTTLGTGQSASFSLARTASANYFASTGQNASGQLGDGSSNQATLFSRVSPLRSLQPLPVELTDFTVTAAGPSAVALAWATASETNSTRFEVERSLDGASYNKVGEVAAAGSSAKARPYAYLDGRAPAGRLYYRLRQVDVDGTSAYSPVRTVTFTHSATQSFTLFPNPAQTGRTTVAGLPAGSGVAIYDLTGRRLGQSVADADGTAQLTLPAGLAAGVYVVRAGGQALRLAVE
jgi:hypothetical protein